MGYSPWGHKESDTTEVTWHVCKCWAWLQALQYGSEQKRQNPHRTDTFVEPQFTLLQNGNHSTDLIGHQAWHTVGAP